MTGRGTSSATERGLSSEREFSSMIGHGTSFGYASLRSGIEEVSALPRIRTRAEALQLMRQRENDAVAQQSRNKEQFEDKEAERKKKLKSTRDAWNIAMSKQKKKTPTGSSSLSETSRDAVKADSSKGSEANEREVAPHVTASLHELPKVVEKSTEVFVERSEMAPNRIQHTLADEDFRLYRERFRKKFPFFSSSATDEI